MLVTSLSGGGQSQPAPANQFASDRPTWHATTPTTSTAQTAAKGISHVHGYWSRTRSRCMTAPLVSPRYLSGDPVGRGYGRRARHDLLPLSHA